MYGYRKEILVTTGEFELEMNKKNKSCGKKADIFSKFIEFLFFFLTFGINYLSTINY